jgi:hypothetical protein
MRGLWFGAAVAAVVAGTLMIPVGGRIAESKKERAVRAVDLSAFDASAPPETVDVVFLHHSVGAQLLAEPGDLDPQHPNGGGLALLLRQNNYRVHEATYGSELGEHTDLFDWLPKFRSSADAIIATARQDERLPAGERNRVVMFKSCYPNSEFVGEGAAEGNPRGPELTLTNAQASFRALREELAKHPDTLFVYLTAPPLAPRAWPEPVWKWLAKKAMGRPSNDEALRNTGSIARRFNNWVSAQDGWLKGYTGTNIVVFDYYDLLTDHGASNFSRYATGEELDSHPSSAGNQKAAHALVPFLNRALRYAQIAR